MRFTVTTLDLISALSTVTRALAARPVRPIMDGVLIQAKDGTVRLTATDGSMTIRADIPALVDSEGSTVLPGRLLSDLSRRLPGAQADLILDGNTVKVRSGKSKSMLTAMDPADFPEMLTLNGGHTMTVSAGRLKQMIGQVAFSTATEEARPMLTGIRAESRDGRLSLTALDGFRLAVAQHDGVAFDDFAAVIPGKAANELARILPGNSDVTLRITDGHMEATFDGGTLSTVLLTGDYPDWRRILPQVFSNDCLVNRDEMQSAIDRASLMARDSHNNLIRMEVGTDSVAVSGRAEAGSVYDTVSAANTGTGLTIAFNGKYLQDVLKAIPEERVVLHFTSAVSPCVIEPHDSKNSTYLVLPVRVS